MKKYLSVTAAALLFALAVSADEKAAEMPRAAVVDQKAPDFTLTDASGKKVSLSAFEGKYVVLEWINFDCPIVRKHYGSKNMQNLQAAYTKKEVVWLSICSSAKGKQGHFEGKELAERMAKEGINSTAYLIDVDGKVGKMYGAKTTPHIFIIDPAGTLIYAGAIDDTPSANPDDIKGAVNYVSTTLDASMAGKPVTVKTTAPYGCGVKY